MFLERWLTNFLIIEGKDYAKSYRCYNLKTVYDDHFNTYTAKKYKATKRNQLPQILLDKDEFFTAWLESERVLKLVDVFEQPSRVHVHEHVVGGTLADLIRCSIERDTKLSLDDVCLIMHQLIDILEFFDRHGVIYRNFKPENIVFTKKDDLSSLKIFNFEAASCEDTDVLLKRHYSSNYMQENAKKILVTEKLLSNTAIDESEFGSIKYLAPEIVLKRDHSEIADIWSVGVIFYLLLTNTHPLQHLADFVGPKEMKQTIVSILESESPELLVDFNHPNLKDLPADILTLLHKMLVIKQKNRISIKDAEAIHCMLNYDWVKLKAESLDSDYLGSESTMESSTLIPSIKASFKSSFSVVNLKLNLYQKFGTKFEDEENLEDLRNLFTNLDYNGAGKISSADVELFYSAMLEQNPHLSKKNAEDCYTLIEGKQTFNKKQFVEVATTIRNILEPQDHLLKKMFNYIIENGDQVCQGLEIISIDKEDQKLWWEDFKDFMMN